MHGSNQQGGGEAPAHRTGVAPVRRTHGKAARWMYRSGHPNRVARALNALWARAFGRGLFGRRWVTLEVVGRRSGATISVPLAVVDLGGERYLAAMLGHRATWVRNVQAAGGHAVLVNRRREPVLLVDVPVDLRAPILRRLVEVAPGARPHVPVDRTAPLADFEAIAADFPVFHVVPDPDAGTAPAQVRPASSASSA